MLIVTSMFSVAPVAQSQASLWLLSVRQALNDEEGSLKGTVYEPVGRVGRFEGVEDSGSASGAFEVLMVTVGALPCRLAEIQDIETHSGLTPLQSLQLLWFVKLLAGPSLHHACGPALLQ